MKTSAPLQQTFWSETELPSMSSVGGSRAKISVLQGGAQGWAASGQDCGANTSDWLANYDPASSSWKTSQLCLGGELATYSETWPPSGMTRNGVAYRLGQWECLTTETVSGLLPTLVKNEPKGAGKNRFRGSPHYRGAKMAEGLRSGPGDPIYITPRFAEEVMGFPIGWTELALSETP